MITHDGDSGCSWWFLCISPLQSVFDFFFLSSLFLSQLFLVGLNRWLLGLKWWVVSVVFSGGDRVMGHGGDWV